MASHADNADGMHHAHVVPAKMLAGVLMALFFLTFITVWVAQFDFGSANMLVAMAIAAVKASLVMAIFMHLRWDTAINNIMFLGSFLFLSLLLIFTLSDFATRGDTSPIYLERAPLVNDTSPEKAY